MNRYRIETLEENRIALHLSTGGVITYWTPDGGGYVYEVTDERPGTSGPQVMDARRHDGTTLRTSGTLADTIRHNLTAPCHCGADFDTHQEVDDMISDSQNWSAS